MSYETAFPTRELGPGRVRIVQLDGTRVAVANVGQTYFALEVPPDADPVVEGTTLVLQGSDARFDIATGRPIDAPGAEPLRRRAVRVEDNEVRIGPADETPGHGA